MDAGVESDIPDVESDIPDVTEFSLEELMAIDNQAVAAVVRRIKKDQDGATIVAGFQSAI